MPFPFFTPRECFARYGAIRNTTPRLYFPPAKDMPYKPPPGPYTTMPGEASTGNLETTFSFHVPSCCGMS